MRWNPFRKREKRATLEEILIQGGALVKDVSKAQAMQIPAVSACVDIICNTIASLPILLYQENGGNVKEIIDNRVGLLNDDSGDTLDGFQFKRAMIEEYLLEGASYAYINRSRNNAKGIHFVENTYISINKNTDPIQKRYEINVNGMPYRDFEFIKLVRKTKDGVTGQGIIKDNNKMFSVAYNTMLFEEMNVKTGGSKKGFLKSESRLSKEAIDELKMAWNNLYKNTNENNVVVLNNGMDFKEATQTSVELQLDQNKSTNAYEICKIFLVPPRILTGEANDEEYNNWIKICILPILAAFECAINKDLLLPSEKGNLYFAFDTNDLLKGDIEKRFKAYEIASKNGIMQLDEIRYKENLPPLKLNFIKLGLQDVLYDPSTKEIYTPNTNAVAKMGDEIKTEPNQNGTGESKANIKKEVVE
jgi:HK97 family phage portal protein